MSLNDIFSRSNSHYFSRPNIKSGNLDLNFTANPGSDNNKNQYVINSALPNRVYEPYDTSIYAEGMECGYPEFDTYNANLTDTSHYILRADLVCDDLIIPAGKTLFTNGYKIYCQRLILSGTISANGKDGRPGVIRPTHIKIVEKNSYNVVTYTSPDFTAATTSGYNISLGAFDVNSKKPPFNISSRSDADYELNSPNYSLETTIGNSKSLGGLGLIGGDGANSAYIALSNASQSVGASISNSLSVIVNGTARGGNGGGSAYGTFDTGEYFQEDGGLGGGAQPPPSNTINIESLLMGYNTSLSGSKHYGGGAGGGGGGSTQSSINRDGQQDSRNYRGVATGGCGGDGGGSIWISAKTIFVNTTGIISANGGKGGNGRAYTDVSRNPTTVFYTDRAYSFSGGGGGGSGGWIILITDKLVNNGLISVRGGAGGTTPTSYISTTHSSGLAGQSGNNGQIYIIQSSSPYINAGFTVSTFGELSKSSTISSSWI